MVEFTGGGMLRVPRHPLTVFDYGRRVLEQGSPAWDARFRGDVAPAMLTGVAAHSSGRMPSLATAGAGLLLGAHAHAAGWGFPVGGSQSIADALADDFRAHGGRIVLDHDVRSPADVEPARVTLLDTSPEFLATFAGDRLPPRYRRRLLRFRRANGVAKVDFALDGPVPWSNPGVALAPTVHLGGTRAEIADAENAVARGRVPGAPYVLATQLSILDGSRAPAGKQVLWAYIHGPLNSTL
ncbi:MAG: dehydrogenase, partial [Microbacteriaceae bacterium]|nr:dehydrogenase [Microbacteriaceae bacterium]